MRFLAIAVGAVVSVAQACAEPRLQGPEAPAPSLLMPGDAIPGDLDVVIRLDWSAVRSVLPQSATELGLALLRHGEGDVFASLYPKADTLWVGFRPGPELQPLDTVMVFHGRLGDFEPRREESPASWAPYRDLGGGWRRWDRAHPVERRDWARIYQRDDDLVVALTVAELDSVARVLERGASDPRVVRAPERGLVSVGVRLGDWVETQGGPGFRWLSRASSLQAYVELAGAQAVAEADIGFEFEDQAARSASAVELLRTALVGRLGRFDPLVRGIDVACVGQHLILRYQGPLRFDSDQDQTIGGPPVAEPASGAADAVEPANLQ